MVITVYSCLSWFEVIVQIHTLYSLLLIVKCFKIAFYFQANFAPESEAAGTKFNNRTGRPDWAVQTSVTPVRAGRPPPPELKPSAQTLGNARGARDPPGMLHAVFC